MTLAKINWSCEMVGLASLVAFVMSFFNKALYHLKVAIVFSGAGIAVLICMPFMIFRPRHYQNALAPSWFYRQFCKAFSVTMEVRGLENIRKNTGSVVLLNHQSALDILVLAYLWPFIGRVTVVCKRELLYIPFFGFGSWLWGTLFINRSRRSDSIRTLHKESKAINERGCKLLIFPEGAYNTKDTLLPFKKGSFHIALQSQCPIQLVVISKYWFLNDEEKIFRPGHAYIHILPEIPTAGCTKDDMDAIIDKTRNIMQSEFTKLSQEAKAINFKKQN